MSFPTLFKRKIPLACKKFPSLYNIADSGPFDSAPGIHVALQIGS